MDCSPRYVESWRRVTGTRLGVSYVLSDLTARIQWSSITAICGTLCGLYMRRRTTARVSAMLLLALACQLERKFVRSPCWKQNAHTYHRSHSFTWLNNRREPVELPACEYMTLMQRWISGKIDDPSIFPTDPCGVSYAPSPTNATATSPLPNSGDYVGKRSGFPDKFFDICQMIFRQMFRVYSHLYWAHFTEPFYHLNLEKQLNSCFSHFLLTATALDMLKPQELEPMQALIDLWAANGTFPPESKAYEYAKLSTGERLIQMAAVPQ